MTLTEWFVIAMAAIVTYFVLSLQDKPWFVIAFPFALGTIATWKVMMWREPPK